MEDIKRLKAMGLRHFLFGSLVAVFPCSVASAWEGAAELTVQRQPFPRFAPDAAVTDEPPSARPDETDPLAEEPDRPELTQNTDGSPPVRDAPVDSIGTIETSPTTASRALKPGDPPDEPTKAASVDGGAHLAEGQWLPDPTLAISGAVPAHLDSAPSAEEIPIPGNTEQPAGEALLGIRSSVVDSGENLSINLRSLLAELEQPIRPRSPLTVERLRGRYGKDVIVIETAARRLLYFYDHNEALVFPVGVARPGLQRTGHTRVTLKRRAPTWVPTRLQHRVYRNLPASVPPGPHNPLGTRALNIGIGLLRIHGTNDDTMIGAQRSDGCFRMYNEDIEFLFELVSIGTRVVILR